MGQKISFPTGIDAHLHVRDGSLIGDVLPFTYRQFGAAIIMPNLKPHVKTADAAYNYMWRIKPRIPLDVRFDPLMTTSLTSDVTKEEFQRVVDADFIRAVKLYAGQTTNASGIEGIKQFAWAFEMLQKAGKPLLLHGEAGPRVDIFDRERMFYGNEGWWLFTEFPELRIVCEHITTAFMVDFVEQAGPNVHATITPHHLLSNRNDMLGKGGLRPDLYCLPILKRESDRQALVRAATSGNPKFFLGTDSAPHPEYGEPGKAKYSSYGCAGSFVAPYALEFYADAFHRAGKLDKLPGFASEFGLRFYGLKPEYGMTTIEMVEPWTPQGRFNFGEQYVRAYFPVSTEALWWKVTRTV